MCDDKTESDAEIWLEKRALSRREFALVGASVAIAAVPGCAAEPGPPSSAPAGATSGPTPSAQGGAEVSSRTVTIDTPDGKTDGFFVAPASGKHPGVLMWPDVAGLREAYRTMATRLASAGYAVLAVNQYYRSSPAPVMASLAEWRTEAGKATLKPMIEAITPAGTTRDASAYVAWLDQQPVVDVAKKIGTAGYCMGGPFTFRTAAAAPGRVGALASFHGGNLVNDTQDSPHLLIATMQAALLVAIAQNDDERDADTKLKLRAAADAAKRPAEIEVYAAQHGWCTVDAPVHDKEQADKAWGRMLATFQAHL